MPDDPTADVAPMTPPAKRPRKAAASQPPTPPPIEGMKPAPEPADEDLLDVDQQRRLEALKAAKGLLGRDVTAGELIVLAEYIERGSAGPVEVDHYDLMDGSGGPILTFTGPNTERTPA